MRARERLQSRLPAHPAVPRAAPPSSREIRLARRRTTFQFEKALQELEALVETLEQGELPLEESLKQFEKGIQLTRQCQEALDAAEQRVEILMQEKGTPEPFEGAEEE